MKILKHHKNHQIQSSAADIYQIEINNYNKSQRPEYYLQKSIRNYIPIDSLNYVCFFWNAIQYFEEAYYLIYLQNKMYTNTAWMLDGAFCWVSIDEEYSRGHIQKLLNQRSVARVILADNKTIDVPVNQILRASNSKAIDLTELPHISEPEVLFKIKNTIYLDRQILLQSVNTSLADFVQYKKYIDERLIVSSIPPHIFSTLFYAYQNLDIGKNSQIIVTGNKGYGKTSIINDMMNFLNKDTIMYYNLIKSFITDNNGHTQGVINYRFIYKQRRLIGLLFQSYYVNLAEYQNAQFFTQKWEELQNAELLKLIQSEKIENAKQFQNMFEKIILIINGLIQLNDNIQMISILEYPGKSDQLSEYIQEKIEQIYIQSVFKNCQNQLIQDQLHELYKQISFEDNLSVLEELESKVQIPSNISKLNNIMTKDTQMLFIRVIQNKQDLVQFRIFDSIKFFKNSYPYRLTFNDFYSRYHHLDVFNRKISLQKHINSNQDMKALVTEICKRLTQSKGLLFGQSQVYFKKEAIENLNKLLCNHNLKLSVFAKIIQRAYRIRQFRKVILACVKKIAKTKSTEQQVISESELAQIENEIRKQSQSQVREEKEEEIIIEVSDDESYVLLDKHQLEEYKKLKKEHIKKKQHSLINGQIYEEVSDVAYSLLTQEQQIQRKDIINKKKIEQQLKELEVISNEASDPESFQLLTQEQKFQYLIMKKQNQTQVAYRLLDQNQQLKIKQQRRLNKIKDFKQKYYDQLEPFLSDLEAFKQLTIGQQNEYKKKKLQNQKNVALSLLSEQQQQNRRQYLVQQRPRQIQKKRFLVDDPLSDQEAFLLLVPIQKEKYKKEKAKFKPLQLLQSKARFGVDVEVSDPESFQLLDNNKDTYIKYKEKLRLCKDISDIEAYLSIDDVNQYLQLKKDGQSGIAKQMANPKKYEELYQLRLQAQQRLDELGLVRYDLLDSIAFNLLNENQWNQRRQRLNDYYQRKKVMNDIGNFCYDLDSLAYRALTIEKKNERKQKEKMQILLKNIINPILFENHLHPNCSVAFRLLQNKDAVYGKVSLAYMLLKDKTVRDQQLKELQVYDWEDVNTLQQKQQLLQEKINVYEQEKENLKKEEFSDYEAYKLLDEDQLLDYQANAYSYLDDEQKQVHRRIIKAKLISNQIHSDLDSFEMLSDDSKEKYKQMKMGDVSDYCAFEMLEDKTEYWKQKQRKRELLEQIEAQGFKIYFGATPQVMIKCEYEKFVKQKLAIQQRIKDEEMSFLKQLQQEQIEQQKKSEIKKTFIIQRLIQNPKSQPYIIYDNCQLNKRILDIRSAPDKNLSFFLDKEFMARMEKHKYYDYCQQVLNHEGKQVQKIMKCQSENLKHPLTKLQNETTALNVFRSITKFAHMKRSRQSAKQHLEKILCALIGNDAQIELPPAPKSLLKAKTIDIDALKKSIQLETAGRRFSNQEDYECNQENREEILLQIFKQIEGNKKEHLHHLLRLCIVITHCIPYYHPIPYIQYLVDKIENPENKLFKDPEIYKYCKQLIKNLALNTNEQVFKNEIKIPLCPRKYLPKADEIQLMFECKQSIVKLFIHSDTPIWVEVDHHYSVKSVIRSACNYVGQQNNWNHFGLIVVHTKFDNIYNTSWLDESANFFDILNKLEFQEEINNNVYKLNKRFEIYLTIKEFFQFNKQDQDILDLVFYQMVFDVKRNKIQLKAEDLQILSELEMYIRYGDNINNQKYNLQDKNMAKLEYLKILRLADSNSIPDIII
ncbi:unnamed protein product [Paramecium octaurelia]|uniref:FERM domain-containing protein n=1 Tax=Paramecium octaurelia TaxID=43137 RepID=A0A8S1WFK7_PAROT|nr:unnamed protein product [Paramecium octaurelia]